MREERCLIYLEDAKDYARHAIAKGLNVLEYLDEVPAADVRPVKRARWIYYDSFALNCSKCRWINYHNMGVPNIYNYCPNCGADMRHG